MKQCLNLAKKGIRNVAPNPMVACVIVHQDKIIGTGYHQQYGKAHAEVNAINSVKDKSLLKESILYVNLEPCAHFGKTPPCSDLIIEYQIPKVIIGCMDTFSEVSGKGIEKLKAKGIEVTVGILETDALELNKRFFTFHNKKRPYIILKWAQTTDGFIDVDRSVIASIEKRTAKQSYQKNEVVGQSFYKLRMTNNDVKLNNWITTPSSKKLVHQWRSEEQAIMVGTNTASNDNPELTVREVEGKNPLRIVLDLNLRLPQHIHLFNQTVPTIVFNYQKNEKSTNLEWLRLNKTKGLITQILDELYQREIQSIIIEGGTQLLNTFIEQNLWDEARVFTGDKEFEKGLKAPLIKQKAYKTEQIDSDILTTYLNA